MIAEQIKKIMKQKGISGNSLAKSMGVTSANLSALLSGKCSPTITSLERVASALGVELWELVSPPCSRVELTAMVRTSKGVYCADSLAELKRLVSMLEEEREAGTFEPRRFEK